MGEGLLAEKEAKRRGVERDDVEDRAGSLVRVAGLLAVGLQAIATSWSSMNPEFSPAAPSRALRRRAVVEAVEKILS